MTTVDPLEPKDEVAMLFTFCVVEVQVVFAVVTATENINPVGA